MTVENIQSTTTLANGVKMPWFGFGMYKVPDDNDMISLVSRKQRITNGCGKTRIFSTSP
jgi:methylglyoxal/glyoxal reductase